MDLFDGCKAFLTHKTADIDLVVRHVGFGIDEKLVYGEIEKSLLEDQADVVIAFLDSRYTELLQPIFEATGKILLLLNMGTHDPIHVSQRSTIIDHSFHFSFLGLLTGQLAAKQGQLKGMMITSYYDGGYPHCFSTYSGYTKEKGKIIETAIISTGNGEYNPGIIKEKLNESVAIDALLCLVSGTGIKNIFPVLTEIQQTREIGVYVSPMMIEESARKDSREQITYLNAKGYTPWLPAIENEANREYQEIFSKAGRKPGLFSMMGWEAGLLLHQIHGLKIGSGWNSTEIILELKKRTIESPRGELRLTEKTNQTYSPVYEVEVGNGLGATIKSVYAVTEKDLEYFHSIKPEGISSGWKNTYLCS